eukprot:TRINITY_DN8773_c0_g1_i14.p1 TRINITY_DN8773_c0_g1~~TRINITY_DN8773_c0_g1_i14.p1  ORF type:complete len:106 (+),score=8.50 TRINITY_DN8773_c0_g1_i14:601-918(+)
MLLNCRERSIEKKKFHQIDKLKDVFYNECTVTMAYLHSYPRPSNSWPHGGWRIARYHTDWAISTIPFLPAKFGQHIFLLIVHQWPEISWISVLSGYNPSTMAHNA